MFRGLFKGSQSNTSAKGVFLDSEQFKKANEALYKQGEELAIRNKTLALLDGLYAVATQAVELDDVADKLTQEIANSFSLLYCAIIYLHSEDNSLEMIGYSEKDKKIINYDKGKRVSDPKYIGYSVINNNSVLSFPPIGKVIGPFFSGQNVKKHLAELGAVTTLVYPLSTERGAIGLLVVGINRPEEQLNTFEREGITSVTSLVAVTIDKAAVYAQLKVANSRLKELDRQKTEFLSIASHQLRTPLSITKGYIELIEDGAFGGKPGKSLLKVLRDIDESNERLVKLVDEFLDITRIEQGRTKFVFAKADMKIMLDSVVKELKKRAEGKGLKISWQPKAKKYLIVMDEEKVRHVAFNFVDNAIKYSEKGVIKVLLEKDVVGKRLLVKIKDNGVGFEEEDQHNFFQKFYRGQNVRGSNVTGTGLGIYVCKKFVEAQGGEVWALSSGIGKGSEFGFSLPLDREDGGNIEKIISA